MRGGESIRFHWMLHINNSCSIYRTAIVILSTISSSPGNQSGLNKFHVAPPCMGMPMVGGGWRRRRRAGLGVPRRCCFGPEWQIRRSMWGGWVRAGASRGVLWGEGKEVGPERRARGWAWGRRGLAVRTLAGLGRLRGRVSRAWLGL